MHYTLGIPTVGRTEILPMALWSALNQTIQPSQLILLDEGDRPVTESYVVRQTLDLMSLRGIEVEIHRNRVRRGIGAARLQLLQIARHPYLMTIDEDVVLDPEAASWLFDAFDSDLASGETVWAVPTCFLIDKSPAVGGYTDRIVEADDPEVMMWTSKYPWFIPYYRYRTPLITPIEVAGTQAILFRGVGEAFRRLRRLPELGKLPREDTYLTRTLGPGIFTSKGICYHFEHASQEKRGDWSTGMFFRIHEAIMESPEEFVNLLGDPALMEEYHGRW